MTSVKERIGTLMIRPVTPWEYSANHFTAVMEEYVRTVRQRSDGDPNNGPAVDTAAAKLLTAVADVARHISDDPAVVRAKLDMANWLITSAVTLDGPDLDYLADIILASLIEPPPPDFPCIEPVRRLLIPRHSHSEWADKFWAFQPDWRRAKYWEHGTCHVIVETRHEAMDRCRVAAFVCGNTILRTTSRWNPSPHPEHLSACAWVNAALVAPAATFVKVIDDRRPMTKFLREIEQVDFDGGAIDVADMVRALLMLGDRDWLRCIKRDEPCLWPNNDFEVWPVRTRDGRDGSISFNDGV